ncbi:hypothetical protein BU15DRAFT_76133 [Melanogaster broomeanus]|nr:hypothetical protein BU15DRAFT_76133 [Melanogaster broomeanus]
MANQVFDYLITIEDEWKARWVWDRKWDTTRLIFTVSRYVPFLGTGLTSYYLPFNSPSAPCPNSLLTAAIVIHIIGVIAAELLLILRTYALWLGDKRLLYGLFAYATITICAAIAIDTSPTQFLPGGQPQLGCLLESPRNGAIVYAILLLYELAIFALIAYKSFGPSRGPRSSIVHIICRDGIFYVLCIIAITLANVIITFWLPLEYSDLLNISCCTAFLHRESCSIFAKASIILSRRNESALARECNGLGIQHIVGFDPVI